jgi:hypothetical protein
MLAALGGLAQRRWLSGNRTRGDRLKASATGSQLGPMVQNGCGSTRQQ